MKKFKILKTQKIQVSKNFMLIAVSSATTSTLVVDADEIAQYIDGINKGSRRRRRRGCSSWQMKRL